MKAYCHISSWCRHSIFGIFFLPIYVSFLSFTPSLLLLFRELWLLFSYRTVISRHTTVIVFPNKEVLPGLIEVYGRVEEAL